MQLTVLRYLIAAAEEGSFTRAAEKLYVAQPSLSQAIHALENELGVRLFQRTGRSVRLTPSGEACLKWARSVVSSEESMRTYIGSAPGGLRVMRIGASPYRSKELLPKAILRFSAQNPGCSVILRDESETNMYDLLDSGDLDL